MSKRNAREGDKFLTRPEKIRKSSRPTETNGFRGGLDVTSVPIVHYGSSALSRVTQHNTGITHIRDYGRGAPGDGLGGRTQSGMIDLVAGFSLAEPKAAVQDNPQDPESIKIVKVYPSLTDDASRISLYSKVDIDENLQFADGNIGSVETKAAVLLKSDSVRIMGREGIKIMTGVVSGESNSAGAPVRSVPRINLIAGNTDVTRDGSRQRLEPVAKANTLMKVIEDLYDQIDKLNSVLDSFMFAQIEFNTQTILHQHPDIALMGVGLAAASNPLAIAGGKTGPSGDLLAAGTKFLALANVGKYDSVVQKMQSAISAVSSVNPAGPKNFASPSVFTT